MRVGDGGGGDVVSAVPDALMGYANVATPNDQSLQGYAKTASEAIQNFLKSNPDPSVMPAISDVGAEAAAYAAQKGSLDQWVFDVGLAFLTVAEQNLPPSSNQDYPYIYNLGGTVVTADESQVQSALTNNPLTAAAKQDATNLSKLLGPDANVFQNRDQFIQLVTAIQAYGNDPIQLAAFFQKLGAKNTLFVTQYLNIVDPKALPSWSAALAAATNSPTWNGSFDKTLTQDAINGEYNLPDGQPVDPGTLSLLLQSGVFSQQFLTNVGNTLMPNPAHIDPLDAGMVVPAFLQALARNPLAAYNYLTSNVPDPLPNEPSVRLAALELMQQGMGGPPPNSWMTALGQAALAANAWAQNTAPAAAGGPPANATTTLLKALAVPDWENVPDSFRTTVLQIVSQHIGSFTDVGNGSGELTAQEQQSLLALALTDGQGSVNQDHVAALQGAIAVYVGTHLPLPDPSNPTAVLQWIDEVSQLSAIPLLGEHVGMNANERAKAQEAVVLQLLFAVAGAFQPELEPEALGLSAGAGKVLNALLDFGEDKVLKEPLQERLLDTFYPSGVPEDIKNASVRQQEAEGELTVAALLYAKNPGWLPGSPDPVTARHQIAGLVQMATSTQNDQLQTQEEAFQRQYPHYSLSQIATLVTQLKAMGGNYVADTDPGGN